MTAPRNLLGRHDVLFFRERVYELEDALEVDEFTLSTIERRRVPFDEVLAATYHRRRGAGFLTLTGFFGAVFAASALLLVLAGPEAALVGALVAAPLAAGFLVAFVLRAAVGVDVITVYGRRTMARLAFGLAKARARDVFERITRRVREHQERLAAELPPEPPPPEVPLPPPPPAP